MSKHRNEMFGVRPLKNFLWWLFGFISPIILLIASIVVGLFVIPVSKYLEWAGVSEEETETYVSKEIANGTVFDGIQGISDYTLEKVPVLLDLLSQLSDKLSEVTINEQPLFKVDKEKLQQLKTSKVIDIQNIFTTYTSCVSVVATINSLGLDLGEFNQLSAIGSFDLIEKDESLTVYFADGTVPEIPQLYYYDISQLQGNSQPQVSVQSESQEGAQEPASQNYSRVFKDDGSLVDELSGLSKEQLMGLNFYYPALNSVPVLDFIKVFPERFKMTTLSSILEVFSDTTEDGALNKILGDETIGSIGGLGFDSFKLVDFIDQPSDYLPAEGEEDYEQKLEAYNRNRELYSILRDATGKENNEDITLEDLSSGMAINNIRLSSIIDAPTEENGYTNKDLYDILKDATGKGSNDEITIGDLSSGMNIDNIRLATIIDAPTDEDPGKNKELYDMLKDATGKADNDKITVGDLSSGMNIDGIRLISIIDEPTESNDYKNKDLYDILKDATGKESNDKITVGDLSSSMSIDNIRLTTIIDAPSDEDPDKNKELYDMLKDATGKDNNDKITVGDLSSGMNIDSIRLASIIEAPSDYLPAEGEEGYDQKLEAYNKNRDLYNMLKDATGKDNNDKITVGDLSSGMNIDNIRLTSIIDAPSNTDPDKNKDLYNILKDATDVDSYDEITIGSLSKMEINNVHLTNILEAPSDYLPAEGEEGYDQKLEAYNRNRDLYKVLKDVTNAETYEEITVGSLSNMDMDNVHLTSILDAPTEANGYKNKDLYKILLDTTVDANTYEDITIGMISDMKIDNVHLSSIIAPPTSDERVEKPEVGSDNYDEQLEKYDAYHKNRDLYNILRDLTNKENDKITVGDLSDIDINNVHLSSILEVPSSENENANKKLYDILLDSANANLGDSKEAKTYETLKVADFNNFNINAVKLSTVMEKGDNNIINTLLKDENVTLGNIGEKINNLSVEEVYGIKCFTTDISEAREDATAYYLTTNEEGKTVYTTEEPDGYDGYDGKTYYIFKGAKVWLFLLYKADGVNYTDSENPNGTGVAETYTAVEFTIGGMNTRIEAVSAGIMDATIRQAYDCGILEREYKNIWGLSFKGVIDKLNETLSNLP